MKSRAIWPMAHPLRACNFSAPGPLQIRAQPRGAAVALVELRQCSCRDCFVGCIGFVLVVRRQFRQL